MNAEFNLLYSLCKPFLTIRFQMRDAPLRPNGDIRAATISPECRPYALQIQFPDGINSFIQDFVTSMLHDIFSPSSGLK
ncbi:MAG: hypothetical protein R6U50_08095 [Desulfobacterales bacterium]